MGHGWEAVIVLDTNVLSELVRTAPSPVVVAWARVQPQETIFATVICEAELLAGIAMISDGRRRADLARAVAAMLTTVLGSRVLPFDRAAAHSYAELAAVRRRTGRPVGMADLQIAAIARARNVEAIATRNTPHFDGCGVPLINSWQGGVQRAYSPDAARSANSSNSPFGAYRPAGMPSSPARSRSSIARFSAPATRNAA